ncbi:transcription factor SPT20 homolog [Diachasmimorpha longicaudata]|uniref:transcription factor SPT20 homolog n=1 Tax=Diachasmimorpha longicaudata TaxID=58733 RepID=UPI0030B8D902
MNRRKVSEGSRKPKALGNRSSVATLHPNTNAITPSKNSEPPPRDKGIQYGGTESCKIYPHAPVMQRKAPAPKTKFTSNDRSLVFSPRLKSFPAEELRRFDASPRVETTPALFQMIGDCDTVPQSDKTVIQSRSVPNHSNCPEVFNVVPVERSPERQLHRPCVPKSLNVNEHVMTENQSEGNLREVKELEEVERQPVGGRNAAVFRQQILGSGKKPKKKLIPELQLLRNIQKQQLEFYNDVQFMKDPRKMPEIMYPHSSNSSQIPQDPQPFPGLGMTSPQDVSMNQSRMYQQPLYNFNYSLQQGPSPYFPYPGYQLSDQPPFHNLKRAPLYVDVGEPTNHGQATQYDYSPQQLLLQLSQQQECPRELNVKDKQFPENLKFTSQMLRDQEKLMLTLRQQGCPYYFMKRQFEGLIAEQRRHLMMIHQQENYNKSAKSSEETKTPTRKRITRVEEDGKPEWMSHITPPWVSYASLEQQENDERKRQQEQQNRYEQQPNVQQNLQQQSGQPFTQQPVNPRDYQQFQQQQMIGNAYVPVSHNDYHAQNAHRPPLHHQHQQNSTAVPFSQQQFGDFQTTNTANNNQILDPGNAKWGLEPSNLVKLEVLTESVGPERRKNGLQDAAAVKEAQKILNSPAQGKTLDMVDNLQKREDPIKLNGMQDPEQNDLRNGPHRSPDSVLKESRTEARANGLENKRNDNNPRSQIPNSAKWKSEAMPVYPRRVEEEDQQLYSMHPSDEYDWIPQNGASALRNVSAPSQGYKNDFQAHVNNQDQGGTSGNPQYLNTPTSSPFDMHSQQRQKYLQAESTNYLTGRQGNGNENERIQGQSSVRGEFDEPRVIGGVTYIGRKQEFIPNSSFSQQ